MSRSDLPRARLAPLADGGRALALALLLALAFAAMRVGGMLGGPALRWMLPLGFCLMAATPWLLLDRDGRRRIGLARATQGRFYLVGIAAGALAALASGALGLLLFGAGPDNWYVSVATNYRAMMDTRAFSMLVLQLVFTTPALLFSPIGEEIFFRGVLQGALAQRWGVAIATAVECLLFGLVHLCHHGVARVGGAVAWLPLSGALWVAQMTLVALLFATLRQRSGSLYPAMAAHAAFNLAMNSFIFYLLW